MMTPSIFTRNNSFWRDPFEGFGVLIPDIWDDSSLEKSFAGFRTDIVEKDGNYELQAELPGFDKEDINVDLKDDILTISASHNEESEEKDEDKKYIRKERHTSSYSRSFKVKNVLPEDIKAVYNNGILEVSFPKRDALPEKETHKIEVK